MADEMVEKVYTFVHTFIHEQGFSPSLREIAEGCYINIVYAIRYLGIIIGVRSHYP